MTTLPGRDKTALIVIDVQNGAVGEAYERDEIVSNISTLVARARSGGVPVIWVQHNDDDMPVGSEAWEYVRGLEREDGEPLIHKQYGDAFEATELESVLAELKVGRLIVSGAQTDQCIRCTLHGAFVRGYDTTLVSDAHTTEDMSAYGAPTPDKVIAHTNIYWRHQRAPGRDAGTLQTAEVDFTKPAAIDR
jgi:nicotinamidase-related amidase